MYIDDIGPRSIQPRDTGGVRETDESSRRQTPEVERAKRTDRVEISEEGRALAAEYDATVKRAEATLAPERVAEIRQRMQDGTYNTPEMAEEVARRMLEQGDL